MLTNKNKRLPEFLKKYFWDINFETLDLTKSRIYILRTILESGDEMAVAWMWKNFSKEELKNTLMHYRGYSRKSANYWALILNIPADEVLCLKKPSQLGPEKIWPY